MSDDLDEFFVHTVSVEARTGVGATGPVYASAQSLACFVEPKRRQVLDAAGATVVSETTLYAPTGTVIAAEDRVTVDGDVTTVITVSDLTSGALELPDHVEVALR